jgi:hypothetical protein
MAIELTVENIETEALTDIPLRIAVTAHGDSVDRIVIKGLPASAQLSAGTRQADGSWIVAAAELAGLSVSFDRRPRAAVELEIDATGTATAGGSIGGSARTRISFRAARAQFQWKNVATAVALVVFSAAVFMCWRTLYRSAQDVLTHDWYVPWEQPADVMLSSGPVTFWYDAEKQLLHHRGSIDANLKLQLLSLAYAVGQAEAAEEEDAPAEQRTPPRTDPRVASYVAAVDSLAYKSNESLSRYFVYLLSLAGLSGMLGTQIRAFANFIYVSTTRNDLNIQVWWPWYTLRPVLGFLLGLMAVLLVEGKLFVPTTDAPPSGTAWWMALAMLVGFAADDFAQRLRLIGQALFGKEK